MRDLARIPNLFRTILWLNWRLIRRSMLGSKGRPRIATALVIVFRLMFSALQLVFSFGIMEAMPQENLISVALPTVLFGLSTYWILSSAVNTVVEDTIRVDRFLPFPISFRNLYLIRLGQSLLSLEFFVFLSLLAGSGLLVFKAGAVQGTVALGASLGTALATVMLGLAVTNIITQISERLSRGMWVFRFVFGTALSVGYLYVLVVIHPTDEHFKYVAAHWKEWAVSISDSLTWLPTVLPLTGLNALAQGNTRESALRLLAYGGSLVLAYWLGRWGMFSSYTGLGSGQAQRRERPLVAPLRSRIIGKLPFPPAFTALLDREAGGLHRQPQTFAVLLVPAVVSFLSVFFASKAQDTLAKLSAGSERAQLLVHLISVAFPIAVAYMFSVTASGIQSNAYGFERRGIISLDSLPLPIWWVIAAKNLVYFAFLLVLYLALLSILLPMIPERSFLIGFRGVLMLISGYLIVTSADNLIAQFFSFAAGPTREIGTVVKAALLQTVTQMGLMFITFNGCVLSHALYPRRGLLFFLIGWTIAGIAMYSASLWVCRGLWPSRREDVIATVANS